MKTKLIALPFIDINVNTDPNDTTWLDIHGYLTEIGWEGSTKEFYKQKFEKEFITKYFDGWVERSHNVYSCKYYDTGFHQIIDFLKFGKYRIISEAKKCDWMYHFIPQTLDHFISDCQRAGVQLKWRNL